MQCTSNCVTFLYCTWSCVGLVEPDGSVPYCFGGIVCVNRPTRTRSLGYANSLMRIIKKCLKTGVQLQPKNKEKMYHCFRFFFAITFVYIFACRLLRNETVCAKMNTLGNFRGNSCLRSCSLIWNSALCRAGCAGASAGRRRRRARQPQLGGIAAQQWRSLR